MEKKEFISSKSTTLPLPENFIFPSTSKNNFTESSTSLNRIVSHVDLHPRSKSLSNISLENYSPGDILKIRERLLRTNPHIIETSAIRNFTKKQKITLALLALEDFISFCSISIMGPFFPREASGRGISDTFIGFIFGFYALVMFITSPIFGKIIPKFGAKYIFLFGIFVAGMGNILFGLLEFVQDYTLFVTLCIVIRGFEALGASAFSTASYVFIVNSFPKNIGSVLGILETFVGLGMSIGPALGGFLYSLGGFNMPFFVIGTVMISTIPLNIWLLPVIEDYNISRRSQSIFKLIKVPTVLAIGAVVVITSCMWSFLDPTLEPHLRQFNLTADKIGLMFMLFSALYGLSSPIWGWLADKVNNHWSMMLVGLISCTAGLLLLGPCPYLVFLETSLWLNILALSILGISIALTLLPTFQGVLTSAIKDGCHDSIVTYGLVAGIWSCMYSLGEVVGPSLGGFLLQYYGFPIASTVMAFITFSTGVMIFFFFLLKSYCYNKDEVLEESHISESWLCSDTTTDELTESSPLLLSSSGVHNSYRSYTEGK